MNELLTPEKLKIIWNVHFYQTLFLLTSLRALPATVPSSYQDKCREEGAGDCCSSLLSQLS